jgi:hypothetical protein
MGGTKGRKTDGGDSQAELAHRVEGRRASVENLLNELGNGSTGSPILRELGGLLLRGDLTGEQKPEETLGKGLLAAGGLGEGLLDVGNGFSTEANTLV